MSLLSYELLIGRDQWRTAFSRRRIEPWNRGRRNHQILVLEQAEVREYPRLENVGLNIM